MTEELHKLHLHGAEIQATVGLRAAAVFANGTIAKVFFTDPKAEDGDALERAIAYARKTGPEEMLADSEAEGVELPAKPKKRKSKVSKDVS